MEQRIFSVTIWIKSDEMKKGEPPLSKTFASSEEKRPTPSQYRQTVSMPGWALLPLRLFLGVTFLYAGVQKLTDPDYFHPEAAGSIGKQLAAFASGSPLSNFLLHVAVPHATLFGACVAYGEVVIGIGTLLGLLLRPAAFFGALLNLVFFLTVSWRVYPYFYGSDIVFVFAWLTLLLAGVQRSGLPTLDGLIVARILGILPSATQGRAGQLASFFLGISNASASSLVQPALDKDQHGMIADNQQPAMDKSAVQGCPEGESQQRGSKARIAAGRRVLESRRHFLWGLLAGGLGMFGITLAGRALHVGSFSGDDFSANTQPAANTTTNGRSSNTTPTRGSGTTTTGPSNAIVQASEVPTNSAVGFTLPANGDYGLLIHLNNGTFVCFDANCTHTGCPLDFDPGSSLLICPCHGAAFDPAHNAKVVRGPARTPLTKVPIKVDKASGAITLQ